MGRDSNVGDNLWLEVISDEIELFSLILHISLYVYSSNIK